MKNMRSVLAVLAAALLGAMIAGCEDNSKLTGDEFRIDPPSLTITNGIETVALTAVGGEEPMTWSVSDNSLGKVSGSGRTVSYTSTASHGVNRVKVVDNKAWEATVTVKQFAAGQVPAANDLGLSPTAATLASDGARARFTASGGTPSYSWSVGDSAKGRVVAQDDTSCVYERTAAGDNTITVRDSTGAAVLATISQPSNVIALSITANPNTPLAKDTDVTILTANGGTPPYQWQIADGGRGDVNPHTGSVVTYTRNHAGDNVVTLTDDQGTVASVIIHQP